MPNDSDELARYEAILALVWQRFRVRRDASALRACYLELRALSLGLRGVVEDGIRADCREDLYGDGADGLFVANCTLITALREFIAIAEVLNENDDVILVQRVLEALVQAFRDRYLSANGRLVRETQATLLGALVSGALERAEAERVRTELVAVLQRARFQIDLPPALIRYLLPTLTRAGRNDLAYRVLLQPGSQGWVDFVDQGAGVLGRLGRTDIAETGICSWLVEFLVGVSVTAPQSISGDGRFHVCVAPKPPLGPRFKDHLPLTHVQCRLPTPCGELEVRWRVTGDRFLLAVRVPVNCTAEIALPDGRARQVTSGRHELTMAFSGGEGGVPTLLESAETGA